jgi:hypothetical protein
VRQTHRRPHRPGGIRLRNCHTFRAEYYACLPRRADGLFELADAVLCADGPVRSTGGLAVGLFRDGVPDTSAAQAVPAGPVAVGLVRGEAVGILAGPSRPGTRNEDLVEHRLELSAVCSLSGRDDQGQRPAPAVGAQVDLGGEATL